MAVVHQFPAFDMFVTLERNIVSYLAIHGIRVNRARILELAEPLGLRDCLKMQVVQLSGGQMKKAQVLCAILAAPQFLLCDEPTAGVDSLSRKVIWSLMSDLQHQAHTTILWTTHDLSDIERRSDSLLILKSGQLVWQGATDGIGDIFSLATIEMRVSDPDRAVSILAQAGSTDTELGTDGLLRAIVPEDKVDTLVLELVAHNVQIWRVQARPLRLEEVMLLVSKGHFPQHGVGSELGEASNEGFAAP